MIPAVERYREARLYVVSLFGVATLISLAGASVAAWHRSWVPLVIFLLAFLYFASRVRSLATRLAQGRDPEHE